MTIIPKTYFYSESNGFDVGRDDNKIAQSNKKNT